MIKDFEDFLAERHAEDYMGCDDDMVDHFEQWVCNLEPEEWIAYAEGYKQIK